MVLEWREREHGEVEEAVRADVRAQQVLRTCGLYKFWCLGGLRAKPGLLQMLVDYWDPDSESFRIDGMTLNIEVEDIYFITGLSRRGEVVNLRSRGGPGHGLTIDEYVAVYCYPETDKVGSQVPINAIQVLGLKAILLTLGRIAGLASLHQASRAQMYYAVECMIPTVYDWSTTLLGNMKHQLSECKAGRIRNFGFSSILSTFFFERVPGLSPRVDVPLHGARDPAQRRWADAMRRLGGGRVANPYPAEFFPWWRRQIVAIDDYPYGGIDFRGDPDMPLPPGSAYGDIGNESQPSLSFFFI